MNIGTLERRYAKALFILVADDLSKAESFYQSLEPILDLFDIDESKRVLVNPVMSNEAKKELLNFALNRSGKSPDQLVSNFISFVLESGRVTHLAGMITAFKELLNEKRGVVKAEITTAIRISEDDIKSIKAALSGRSEVEAQGKVDPSILGGMIVRIGNDVVDMSLKRQLDLLAKA